MSLVDAALALGVPVFACDRRKRPCVATGFKAATVLPMEISRQFSQVGAALIGVPTGEASGWDALDVDPRHDGDAWELENRHRIPETRVHQTPSGGRHYIFLHAPGVRNSAGVVAPGVDVRGTGGYICAPPSPGYSIVSDADPCHWPDWLLALVLKQPAPTARTPSGPAEPINSKRISALVDAVVGRVRAAPDGQKHFVLRNQALFLGGIQHLGGFSTDEAVRRLVDALPASARDIEGARKTARWGVENGARSPIDLPDREQFRSHGKGAEPPAPEVDEYAAPPDEPVSNRPDWREALVRNDKGKILATASNALTIISGDAELQGTFARNVFTAETVLTKPMPASVSSLAPQSAGYPRQWTESDVFLMQAYLHRFYSSGFSFEMAQRVMTAAASTASFHPVLQWVEDQKWDGSPRIDAWLINAFGTEDSAYVRAVASKFLIAAVRRIRSPGCQFDHMPVLEGPQGIGKSKACRTLFGDHWFTDDMPHDFKNKDSPQALLGVWGIELSEVAQVTSSKAEMETIKAFLSRRVDRFRPPYGRGFILQPRQGVFIGTTNRSDWLTDETGNRRFWPIECKTADPAWIAVNRDQLWAEAAVREAAGESVWLDTDELQQRAVVEQEKRLEDDVWAPLVHHFLRGKDRVQISDVLTGIGVTAMHQDKRAQMRVGRIMKVESWVRHTVWNQETQRVQKEWRSS